MLACDVSQDHDSIRFKIAIGSEGFQIVRDFFDELSKTELSAQEALANQFYFLPSFQQICKAKRELGK